LQADKAAVLLLLICRVVTCKLITSNDQSMTLTARNQLATWPGHNQSERVVEK